MPQDSSTERRARRGYVLLAALFAAAVVVFNADALAELARDRLRLVAILPQAEGVRVGTAVWVAGVESGRVTRVGFIGEQVAGDIPGADSAAVAVHVQLDERTRRVITRESDVHAMRVRFIGQPVIQIEPGGPGEPPVDDGDTLVAQPRPEPLELLERSTTLPASLDSLARSVQRINEMAATRGPQVRRLATRLDALMQSAGELSAQMEGGSLALMLDEERGIGARMAALRERMAELQQAVDRLARYAPASAGDGDDSALARSMARLAERAAQVEAEVADLQATLAKGDGFLVRAQRDSALQVAVRGVQAQIDSLTAEAASFALRMLLP